jgi:hypothetical protein
MGSYGELWAFGFVGMKIREILPNFIDITVLISTIREFLPLNSPN